MTMSTRSRHMGRDRHFAGSGLLLAWGLLAGCTTPPDQIPDQCGLGCAEEGILAGNSKISGIPQIDAFFGAIIDSQSAAASVRASIRADLDAIALSVGLPRGAEAELIANAIAMRIAQDTEAGLALVFDEPVCRASVAVTAAAAAECDADVELGMVDVMCEGSCQAESGTAVDCGPDATLVCIGTAPNLQCTGRCTGECNLPAGDTCDGICRGICTGICTVQDAQGNCAGACDGTCQGSCDLEAGGTCPAACQGTCTWEAGGDMCEATVAAECEADAGAAIQCEGNCEGVTRPPAVSAECEATVEAKSGASVDCAPPHVTARWQWSVATAGDQPAQAAFRAWVEIVAAHAASMVSKGVKGDIIINGFQGLGDSAAGAFRAAVDAALVGDLKAKIGADCALDELEPAVVLVDAGTSTLLDAVEEASIVLSEFE